MSNQQPPLSYRSAGVDISAGDDLVHRIKDHAKRTTRPEVLGGLGGFGGLFELPLGRYQQPVLVAGTDGVGTKLLLGIQAGRHRSLGIDLVAMCANDIAVCGAEPLFFLDYYASSALQPAVAADVVAGISDGCIQAGAALIGGETAEMPGVYQPGDYDLAGFCVGIVDKERLIDGSTVSAGDALIGLASSGPHANGFSLIRAVIERSDVALDQPLPGSEPSPGSTTTLLDQLLTPTRIYVKSLQALAAAVPIKALAHITGGGISDNLPRSLPDSLTARIDTASWQRPVLFDWLQQQGDIADAEMWRTFNCGVGMIVCVAQEHRDSALAQLNKAGETAWLLGEVVAADAGAARVQYSG